MRRGISTKLGLGAGAGGKAPSITLDSQFVLSLDPSTLSSITSTSVRNVFGYNGDPSAVNAPELIAVPAGLQAIVGGRWDGAKFVTTFTNGQTMHPFISQNCDDGQIKKFIAYATYAVSTAYAAGVQVAKQSDNGNWLYMSSSGGTSDSSAVVITESDIGGVTVSDNDIEWSVLGFATLHTGGTLLESASTQKLLNSDSPATQTTASLGTGSWTLSVYGSGSAIASAGTATISGEAAASDGSPDTFSVDVAGTVTITVTGSPDVFQLESGTFPTSIIISTGTEVTRAATTLSDTTAGRLTTASGAGRLVVTPSGANAGSYSFASQVDGNNFTGVFATSTTIRFIKVIASAATSVQINYTHQPDTPFCIDFFYNQTDGMAVRAFSIGDTPPSFNTDPNTDLVQLASTFTIGSRATNFFDGDYISVELSTDKADLGF